ncbi:hypothetical protein [Robertmurraya kyonggiensis]|uniref:hypothetical protein n=1 Tax=Robertmurraya kyonggiensis TaxID=1037680 RepID=UPI00130EDCBB|nr:hypothetical protein [Robertmurraya kyonggiensis]
MNVTVIEGKHTKENMQKIYQLIANWINEGKYIPNLTDDEKDMSSDQILIKRVYEKM